MSGNLAHQRSPHQLYKKQTSTITFLKHTSCMLSYTCCSGILRTEFNCDSNLKCHITNQYNYNLHNPRFTSHQVGFGKRNKCNWTNIAITSISAWLSRQWNALLSLSSIQMGTKIPVLKPILKLKLKHSSPSARSSLAIAMSKHCVLPSSDPTANTTSVIFSDAKALSPTIINEGDNVLCFFACKFNAYMMQEHLVALEIEVEVHY